MYLVLSPEVVRPAVLWEPEMTRPNARDRCFQPDAKLFTRLDRRDDRSSERSLLITIIVDNEN